MSYRRALVITAAAIVVLAIAVPLAWYQRSTAPAQHKTTNTTDQPDNPDTSDNNQTPNEPEFDKTRYSTTDPASPWAVVNKQHPINPTNYAPTDLASVGNGQRMRAEAATALQKLFADAKTAGYTLVADSGYRSYSTQVSTYNGYVKRWGQTYTDTISARPGYSEHQTGWAVDVGSGGCHVDSCFGDLPAGQWAQANAYKYGFLLRYPAGLTDVTGYAPEAWHFRYVGPLLASELHAKSILTLEQFFDITGGTTYK